MLALIMPMIPEAAVAMLACARLGAIHSVIFGGFSAESVRDRVLDADCRILRKIAAHEADNLGDISTLADPGVVQALIEKRAGLGA